MRSLSTFGLGWLAVYAFDLDQFWEGVWVANVGAFGAADSIDDSVLIPRLSQRT